MTIRKGEDWGTVARLPDGAPIVATDRALAALFSVVIDGGELSIEGPAHVGMVSEGDPSESQDIARTVSARSTPRQLRTEERPHLPIDLCVVTLDGRSVIMAASLVIRRPWWVGAVDAAMNASFLGEWNVAPGGHPNDGRVDVVHAQLGLSDRLKARGRLASGTHLPHPDISIRRLKHAAFAPDPRAEVWIDGHRHGTTQDVDVTVIPDATTIVI